MPMLIPGTLDYEAERFWIISPRPLLPLPLRLSPSPSLFLAKLKPAFLIQEIPTIRDEPGIIQAFSDLTSRLFNFF